MAIRFPHLDGDLYVLRAGDTMTGDLDIGAGIHLDTDGSATFAGGIITIDAAGNIDINDTGNIILFASGAASFASGLVSIDLSGNVTVGSGFGNIFLNADGSASFLNGGFIFQPDNSFEINGGFTVLAGDGSASFALGGFTIDASGNIAANNFDTDGTLAANSDTQIATQKAVKTYVDNNTITLGQALALNRVCVI